LGLSESEAFRLQDVREVSTVSGEMKPWRTQSPISGGSISSGIQGCLDNDQQDTSREFLSHVMRVMVEIQIQKS
jgi:hypothetical protein